jgi:2-polyprenyl-3-methyl-5-hydroxy-6-metoxy-1,4-benzoquinol methylase
MEFEESIRTVGALIKCGRLDEAQALCQEILADSELMGSKDYLSHRAQTYEFLGDISLQKNQLNETITYYLNALNLDDSNDPRWIKFANTIKFAQFNVYHRKIEDSIIKGLSKEHLTHQHFTVPGISLLKLSPAFQAIPGLLKGPNPHQEIILKLQSKTLDILQNRLLLELMQKTLLADEMLEKLITYSRHALLVMMSENTFDDVTECYHEFIYALAAQCFHNEYVNFETNEEVDLIEKLILNVKLQSDFQNLSSNAKAYFALLGSYRPLHMFSFSLDFLTHLDKAENIFQNLVRTQVLEPLEEEKYLAQIRSLKSIQDEISNKVRDQYEENPYPRWSTIDLKTSKSTYKNVKDLFPALDLANTFSTNPEILVAGCGTGQHALNCAIRYKNSKILAVDLSKRSLAYAAVKASELNIHTIDFLQADILDLEDLNRTFDVIECVGVLHHMRNPFEGWRILTKLLKPNGLMVIGLYSQQARQDVNMARVFIKNHGYQPTLEGIRECRQKIFQLPESDPVHKLSYGADFYSTSACRDLLFHVQEHQFTIPQIQEEIKRLGLTFLGFEFKNPISLQKYHEEFPDEPTAQSLGNWNIFEQKYQDTFVGMYCFWLKNM